MLVKLRHFKLCFIDCSNAGVCSRVELSEVVVIDVIVVATVGHSLATF